MLKPQVGDLSVEFEKRVDFFSISAGPNRELLIELEIGGLPSFMFFKKGKKENSLSGSNTRIEEIREQIGLLLGKVSDDPE